jgi:hypothetical protein
MVMSNPRSHYDTLLWVRKFCGSFSILPVWLYYVPHVLVAQYTWQILESVLSYMYAKNKILF